MLAVVHGEILGRMGVVCAEDALFNGFLDTSVILFFFVVVSTKREKSIVLHVDRVDWIARGGVIA